MSWLPSSLLEINMAMSIKLKAKPKGKTRSQVKSIDHKAYGDEPLIEGTPTETELTEAFNFYNYMYDQTQAKKWLIEYMKKNKYSSQKIDEVRSAPDWRTPTTTGWMARMMMNGTVFNEAYMDRFEERIRLNALAGMKTNVPTVKANVVSIQDRTQAKIKQLICDCEEAIDADPALNVYDWLKRQEATAQAATAIRDFYSRCIGDHEPDEFDTRAEKKRRLELKKYWEEFIADCDRYIGNKKAVKIRKPRERKVKSAIDLVKNLKFQKEDPSLKIVSVNPAEIIGCKQLWVYNTKYKKLTRYDASGPNGIQVKGTTLTGYDVESALTKSLRKPDISLQSLLSTGKVALRSFMSELKTNETKPNGRINEFTILLRVIK